jgi:hypothetical protein
VRSVTAAIVALIGLGPTAPLNALEAVRLPMSCNYVANKVVLAPSANDQLHVIVGDREHKTLRGCAPGLVGKCRTWEVHRFDLMCGGKQVSWRAVAGHLLNLASLPVRKDALPRTHFEPWELRALVTETEFAPVDEFGGRILSFADKSILQAAVRDAADVTPTDAASTLPVPRKSELDSAPPESEALKAPDVFPARSDAPAQPSSGAISQQPDMPLSVNGGPKAATEGNAADDKAGASDAMRTPVGIAVPDTLPANKTTSRPQSGFVDLFLTASASALLLITAVLMTAGAVMWWRSASSRPHAPYGSAAHPVSEAEGELDADAMAEECRELMKQVTTDLVKAMGAVNGLKGVPALQTALHTELDSIRRSLGFTPQTGSGAAETKDWHQIKLKLTLGLQGTQRIIGIAQAARTSFPVHPAALEVITTRLEAYAFLGVNASSSEMVLKKAVNALRQCWHPDLATDEEDRRLREIRIKQINVAWDLISRKQMSF